MSEGGQDTTSAASPCRPAEDGDSFLRVRSGQSPNRCTYSMGYTWAPTYTFEILQADLIGTEKKRLSHVKESCEGQRVLLSAQVNLSVPAGWNS